MGNNIISLPTLAKAALAIMGAYTLAGWAGPADVVMASADCDARRVCRFSVTLRHADSGWTHYADRWEVLTPSGETIATRVLLHPHVDEQPFTRELPEVVIPAGLKQVTIRAHDKQHGYGGSELKLNLNLPVP